MEQTFLVTLVTFDKIKNIELKIAKTIMGV